MDAIIRSSASNMSAGHKIQSNRFKEFPYSGGANQCIAIIMLRSLTVKVKGDEI